jgi:hypothetical protein
MPSAPRPPHGDTEQPPSEFSPAERERYYALCDELTRRLRPVCADFGPEDFAWLVHEIAARKIR